MNGLLYCFVTIDIPHFRLLKFTLAINRGCIHSLTQDCHLLLMNVMATRRDIHFMALQCYANTLSACSGVLVRIVWESCAEIFPHVALQHPRSGISGDFMGFSDNDSESEASDTEVGDKKKDSISSNVRIHVTWYFIS